MLAALLVFECDRDGPLVAIPRPEIQLVVRFGTSARRDLDVHVLGARPTVHRKLIRRGQRAVTARLRLGAASAVLGVPAPALAGRVVPLEELWGNAATRALCARLADARHAPAAAAVLEHAIAERMRAAGGSHASGQLALAAADKLASAVSTVAVDLGVSERHLRRLFRETVGVSPKTFAKLSRFHRALHAARRNSDEGWANIAAATGYYDQAHLIAEFRAIAGVTPRALLSELRAAPPVG